LNGGFTIPYTGNLEGLLVNTGQRRLSRGLVIFSVKVDLTIRVSRTSTVKEMIVSTIRCGLCVSLLLCGTLSAFAQTAEPWQAAYTGEDAGGAHVIAFWNFDGEEDAVVDLSGNNHAGTFQGAVRRAEGRFGGCMESFPGWPVEDVRHSVQVQNAAALSPGAAFTIEMWICPGEALDTYDEAFIVDKKYVAHTDYQWVLEKPDTQGNRRMRVCLGFGADSETWWSTLPVSFAQGVWRHIAFSYDGAGTVQFFCDGSSLGKTTKPGRRGICPGDHFLSLGDRVGSYYHGFPGRIDEVRITSGAREFRPVTVRAEHVRTAYLRMETPPALQFRMHNRRREPIMGLTASVSVPGKAPQVYTIPELAPSASHLLEYVLDTRLRPGLYTVTVECRLKPDGEAWVDQDVFTVHIVPRPEPHRMPVVMWGIGGVESVAENLETLKDIGFTHCLGLGCDYDRVWDAGTPVSAVTEERLAASRRMLDTALVNDLGIVISLGIGHWLESKPELLRIDREGKVYERGNICCNFPQVPSFAYNVGASVAQTYGEFPAFTAALINTEVRDGTQLCFHEHDRQACREATGQDYPDIATQKNGVSYADMEGFPATRVIPDDYSPLQFYRWFWREGDGWNHFHTAVNNGLKSTGRGDLWTFFDPAVRVPPLWGSGGNVDFLSHWTYSYPDPIRIGLCADELFAMAGGGPENQDVMKMTQIIWYRSQTAPAPDSNGPSGASSPWEDHDPDAAYITIAPTHLKEAFWTKIARPVKGIMYHGWQSLVKTEGGSSYRYTHPETRYALKTLVASVVRPLGPTLLQVTDAPADVAFLESFASSMFAGRGTYGWGGSWAGDAYQVLLWACLQPRIVYEETIMKSGLEGYRILVLADCDVLTAPVVERILAFQQSGGIIVGDERLCPAVKADILIETYSRTKEANKDKEALLARAQTLREHLSGRYAGYLDSSEAEVLPYLRRYGSSDYVFAINDRREYGSYVGHHGLVMENGLPADARITVNRAGGFAYDLLEQRALPVQDEGNTVCISASLEPGGGRLWLITKTPITGVTVDVPAECRKDEEVQIKIAVVDADNQPMDAVVPLEIDIQDPDGRSAEPSGYYGARDGSVTIPMTPAPNDVTGVWTIKARELASSITTRAYFRLLE